MKIQTASPHIGKKYVPCEMEWICLLSEDVIRTSFPGEEDGFGEVGVQI